MKTIYKYELEVADRQMVKLPVGAEILSVFSQKKEGTEELFIWAMIDTKEENTSVRWINVYGTGNPIIDSEYLDLKFIGTCHMFKGSLVWHVFESVGS